VELGLLGLAPAVCSADREAGDAGEDARVAKVREVSIGPGRVVWGFGRLNDEQSSFPVRFPWCTDESPDRRQASHQEPASCCSSAQDETRFGVLSPARPAFGVADRAIFDCLPGDAGKSTGRHSG
jgi:hypothetical protein